MKSHILWPAAGVLALLALAVGFGTLIAQWHPAAVYMPQQPGRFVVAHASANQVLILDSATGQVYQAREGDFKRMTELPRAAESLRLPGRDPEPAFRPRENFRDRLPGRDEKDKGPEWERDKDKDKAGGKFDDKDKAKDKG